MARRIRTIDDLLPARRKHDHLRHQRRYVVGLYTDIRRRISHGFTANAFVPGDATGDGTVDVNDLAIVTTNFGQSTGMTWTTGDFTGDGTVDINDLRIVLASFGPSVSASGSSGLSAVPGLCARAGPPSCRCSCPPCDLLTRAHGAELAAMPGTAYPATEFTALLPR